MIETDDQLFEMGLYTICQTLIMSNDGSADPLPLENKENYIRYLTKRLSEWEKHPEGPFSVAVKFLVRNTLIELGRYPGIWGLFKDPEKTIKCGSQT